MRKRIRNTIVLLALMASVVLPAWADPPGEMKGASRLASFPDPRNVIEGTYERIQERSAGARSVSELDAEIVKIFDEVVSWEAFTSRTLGKATWRRFDTRQRKAFISAYKKLIARKYSGLFEPQPERPFEVEYRGEQALNETTVVVKTTVFTHKDGKRIGVDVDYRFIFEDSREFRLSDIVTDTVSRALSYRNKFQRLYNERGFEALVARIAKNADRSRP